MADFADEMAQVSHHSMLMCCGSVPTTLGHNNQLVEAKWGSYCRVFDVVGVYFSLKESIRHIQLAQILPFLQSARISETSGRGKQSGTVLSLSSR